MDTGTAKPTTSWLTFQTIKRLFAMCNNCVDGGDVNMSLEAAHRCCEQTQKRRTHRGGRAVGDRVRPERAGLSKGYENTLPTLESLNM